MRAVLAVVAVVAVVALGQLAGCAIGAGSAYVGQWRPRTEVAIDACLVDEAGRCTDHKQVIETIPARRFWGVLIAFPALGGASVSHAGEHHTRLRFEPSLEILRGHGRFAWGVRGSFVGDDAGAFAFPVTGLGHLSLTPRLGVYGGVGYSPFARLVERNRPGEITLIGGRALVGLQLAFSRAHSENFMVLSLEADTLLLGFDDPYRSTGVTGHLGLFF